MANLIEQVQSITSGSSVSVDVSVQAGSITQIAELVIRLAQNPPDDLASFLQHLQTIPTPQINVDGSIAEVFQGILPGLQEGLGVKVSALTQAAGAIGSGVSTDLTGRIEPLLAAVNQLKALLDTDWSCGLVPALAASPAASTPSPGPASDPSPDPSPDPAPADASSAERPAVLSTSQVDDAKALADTLPPDMAVKALLIWLHQRVGTSRPGYFQLRSIPVLDDLRDPLDSLVRWDAMSGAQLQQEFVGTLNVLTQLVQAEGASVVAESFPASLAADLPLPDLKTQVDALIDALEGIPGAADPASLAAAAQSAAQAIELHNQSIDAQLDAIEAQKRLIRELPSKLETRICRLLMLATPRATFGDLSSRLGEIPQALPAESFAPLTDLFANLQEWIENILKLLDFSAVLQAVTDAVQTVEAEIAKIEQGIAELTADARALFGEASTALGAVDLSSFQQQIEDALQSALQDVQVTLGQGLSEAAGAMESAMTEVNDALAGFDPETLGAPVAQVLEALRDLFQDSTVQQLMGSLDQIKALANRVDELSFKPVGDTVISGIEEIKDIIAGIDVAQLPPPGAALISTALKVLPPSLSPVINPLIAGAENLVEAGPVPVLETIRDLPKPILDEMRGFSPRDLLDEPLNVPFQNLLGELEGFDPLQWVSAADEGLESLKQSLLERLDIQALLAPLADAQKALLQSVLQFRPGAVIAPLTSQLESAAESLSTGLPGADLVEGLEQALARVQQIFGTLWQALDIAGVYADRFALLLDPSAQLDAWLEEILDKLPDAAAAAMQAELDALGAAVDAMKADAINAAYEAASAPLRQALEAMGAGTAIGRLAAARSRLSPTEAQASPWLESFSPSDPVFNRGLRACTALHQRLEEGDQAMSALMTPWDARYHAANGALANLRPASFSKSDLQQWLREALHRQLGKPVVSFLTQLQSLGGVLRTFVDGMEASLGVVQTRLDEVLSVPQALADAAAQLTSLQDAVGNIDLQMFNREVDALYEQLLEQVRALDVAVLAQQLRDAMSRTLNTLSLADVLTPGLRQGIEQAYGELLAKVEALDPELLVIEPLDTLYRQDILPLVGRLDFSEPVQKLIDVLRELPDELKDELNRVDLAYQELLASDPGGSGGASISISVSI